jgi:prepilin-type processing-associated H-X9-DG protein
MPRRATILVAACLILVSGSLLVVFIGRLRAGWEREACKENLHRIMIQLHDFHALYGRFPAGTVYNNKLEASDRLSWYVMLMSTVVDQGELVVDRNLGWQAAQNQKPLYRYRLENHDVDLRKVPLYLCPANPPQVTGVGLGYCHFVGIAGVGKDIGTVARSYPDAGFFGYDPTPPIKSGMALGGLFLGIGLENITDGAANTLAVVETATESGPWTAGGYATVRGLDPSEPKYIGLGCEFGSNHPAGLWSGSTGIANAGFADGSVRQLSALIDKHLLEALATIAGGENVSRKDLEGVATP